MPVLEWLRKEFDYGYRSGDILADTHDERRASEEKKIGGSYRRIFNEALRPYLRSGARVLELGPGGGDWTRAIMAHIPGGEIHTIDFQDVNQWISPDGYDCRLINHRIADFTDYGALGLGKGYFDLCWSFGVLCHNNLNNIEHIFRQIRPHMKIGGIGIHQYSDWEKLTEFGWDRGGVPPGFQFKPDDEIWWPRNTKSQMQQVAETSGWVVESIDLNLLERDSMILMKRLV